MNQPLSLLDYLDPITDEHDPDRTRQFRRLAVEAVDELDLDQRSPLATELGLYDNFEDDDSCHLLSMLLDLYETSWDHPEDLPSYDYGMLISAIGCDHAFAAHVKERIGWRFAARFERSPVSL